ncbi:hypothetical protein [Micromonospora coxensis]|uniref:Uncharacterized protein n=1 Tax=Micromonospora coxensis TaxID=356852 RepID=A0A1C5JC23_9ACTN|nr:hypothetical protein [Micromonospora coxensis]SCG67739.1 hypothetical protein GA0070614_4291 [Micromonospora coxensis]
MVLTLGAHSEDSNEACFVAEACSSRISGVAVVGKKSIDGFYADAEGRGWDAPGYDWENDDRPDQTPDSWLDRLTSSPTTRRVGAAMRGTAPRVSKPPPARAATGGARAVPSPRQPSEREIAEAAHRIRAEIPNIGPKGIAKRLRQHGWTRVDHRVVGMALQRHPAPAAGGKKNKAAPASPPRTTGRSERLTGPAKKTGQAGGTGQAQPLSKFERAVRTARIDMPGMDVAGIVRRLRRYGWPTCTDADVRHALGMSPGTGPVKSGRSRPPRGNGSATKRAQPLTCSLPAAEICPSCGVRVSMLGTCRCS